MNNFKLMKKTLFLIIFNAWCISVYSQQALLNEGSADLPGNSAKITKERAMDHVSQRLKNDKAIADYVSATKEDIYNIKDVLVILHGQTGKMNEGHLAKIKETFDWGARNNPTYHSELKRIDKDTVLTMERIFKGIGDYHFYAVNAAHSKVITGALYFDEANIENANEVLKYIINHLHFKD
jgi:hypothetical protein